MVFGLLTLVKSAVRTRVPCTYNAYSGTMGSMYSGTMGSMYVRTQETHKLGEMPHLLRILTYVLVRTSWAEKAIPPFFCLYVCLFICLLPKLSPCASPVMNGCYSSTAPLLGQSTF